MVRFQEYEVPLSFSTLEDDSDEANQIPKQKDKEENNEEKPNKRNRKILINLDEES